MNQLTKNILWMVLGGIIVLGVFFIYLQQSKIQKLELQDQNSINQGTSAQEETSDMKAQNDDTILYTNEEYGFSFELPKNWEGYEIRKIYKRQNTLSIGFQGKQWNEIFYIVIHTRDEWEKLEQENSDFFQLRIFQEKIGENQEYVFVWPHGIEVPSDEEEFYKYLEDIDGIKSTFKAF